MSIFKPLLSYLIPDSYKLRYLSYLPKLRTTKLKNKNVVNFEKRSELYNFINRKYINDKKINYLEFGVYKGESIKFWTKLNLNKDSRFFGFDTFTGLPENWDMFFSSIKQGRFSVRGKVPKLNDRRVKFVKGMFQKTLSNFLNKNKIGGTTIINLDADLYSSTLYVLTKLDDFIKPGTIVILDQFSSPMNELRALEDYSLSYQRKYKLIATHNFSKFSFFDCVAIKITK